jgi:hypothetical protein
MSFPAIARPVGGAAAAGCRYSICTLVSNPSEYGEMVESFVRAGFHPGLCEYLYCDNSGSNRFDAFAGCNAFLDSACGEHLIFCHQDVLLNYDRIDKLERIIREMDVRDPGWGLLGNAGGIRPGHFAVRITHAGGGERKSGKFPARVQSLDENFILIKRSASLRLSPDLHGFHFYGTELCQAAQSRGLTAWVVDFHLLHKSTGKYDASFLESYQAVCRKYRSSPGGGYIQTTCALIPVGRSWWRRDRALFLFLRGMKKNAGTPPGALEAHDLAMQSMKRWRYLLQLMLYKPAVPAFNLIRSIRKRINKGAREP